VTAWGAEESVDVDGVRLRILRAGEGPPLLLINGIGASADMWAPLVAVLTGREIVAIDLPGSGATPVGPRPMRIRGLARLVAGALDALGHETVDVLGYSFGGIVAQELAWRSPERVGRLVLCATSPGIWCVPPNPLSVLLMLTPAQLKVRTAPWQTIPLIAGGRTARDPAALDPDVRIRLLAPLSTWGYLSQLYAVSGWTSLPWLWRLRQPTLILHGDDDPLVPVANARWMADLLPDARLSVVPEAGHLLLLDEPDSVVEELTAFLAGARQPV
jgi:poly(3-hydroxyoctanoate) depolymerase